MSSLRLLRHNCPHLKGPKYDLKIYVDDAVKHIHTYLYVYVCILQTLGQIIWIWF